MTSRKLLILNARSIAKDQRVHGGKMGPQLGKLIVALCDELEALSLLPPAQGWGEMLEALKEVAHHADDEAGFMVLVRAAIQKAEGAAPPLPVDRETPQEHDDEDLGARSRPSTQLEPKDPRIVDSGYVCILAGG